MLPLPQYAFSSIGGAAAKAGRASAATKAQAKPQARQKERKAFGGELFTA
jgi:hypothetical protein